MAWKTPKTNWVSTDFFNIEDYNRIIGNISYIRGLAVQVWPDFSIAPMGSDKTYSDYVYAREVNVIESNITRIVSGISFPLDLGEEKTYSANKRTPDYAEFNRIESACLALYNNLIGQISGRPTMQFTLNGGDF